MQFYDGGLRGERTQKRGAWRMHKKQQNQIYCFDLAFGPFFVNRIGFFGHLSETNSTHFTEVSCVFLVLFWTRPFLEKL